MTLDEAIKHCEEKADELNKEVLNQANLCNAREMADCQECAREHEQLLEWLRELKAYKESPKGDLISREALKKDFEERNKACDKWIAKAKDEETKIRASAVKSFICEVIMTIDNAPTVDTSDDKYLEERDADAYETGYLQGHIEGYQKAEKDYARPIGEWITRHKLNSFGQDVVCFECNKCGEYKVPLYHLLITEPLKVCPNCGADMRKGGAENDL